MKTNTKVTRKSRSRSGRTSQRGTAIIIAVMIMALLAIGVFLLARRLLFSRPARQRTTA